MPSSGAILWAAIAGGFSLLVLIIGWFLNHASVSLKGGMESVTAEVKGLRSDIGRYHDSEMETKGDLKAHIQKCEERHRLLSSHYSIRGKE